MDGHEGEKQYMDSDNILRVGMNCSWTNLRDGGSRDTEHNKKEFHVISRFLASTAVSTIGSFTELRKNRHVVENWELHFGHFMVKMHIRYSNEDVKKVVK